MKYYAHIFNGKLDGKGQCPVVGDNAQSVEITEEVYNDLEHYIWNGSDIILNPNYDKEQEEKEKAQFRRDYFQTSLGWVSRTVHMLDGSTCKFLTDILPLLAVGAPILVYTEDKIQSKVLVTEEFLSECKNQVLIDFYGANVNE